MLVGLIDKVAESGVGGVAGAEGFEFAQRPAGGGQLALPTAYPDQPFIAFGKLQLQS